MSMKMAVVVGSIILCVGCARDTNGVTTVTRGQ